MKLEEMKDSEGHMALAKNLREALEREGVLSVEQLAISSLKDIMAISGFGEKTARQALLLAQCALLSKPFMTAQEYHDLVDSRIEKLTTGSKQFDTLIGGGIRTTDVTEVWGESDMGKSQLCMQLSVNVQLPKERGGLNGECLFIDIEGSFSTDRVVQMAKALDIQDSLHRIILAQVFSSSHQQLILEALPKVLEQHPDIRLILVDSIIGHYRSEYIGREVLSERQQKLNEFLGTLRKYARAFNIAVVYTDQAISNPTPFGMDVKAAGGNVLAHGGTPTLWIKAKKKDVRVLRLCKSPYLAEGECVFRITEKGIEDMPEKQEGQKPEQG